jgi:pyridoxamine 5'-phosphate oxidase
MSVADLRKEYTRAGLDEADTDRDPLIVFQNWFAQAVAAKLPEPNAMTLATVTGQGRPAARVVLLKGFDERGFAFYTNHDGRKGQELAGCPFAALVFHWAELERQVRIEGSVTLVEPETADAYFASRPLGNRLGAWASPQGQVIASRAALDELWHATQTRFADGNVPRPPNWGGYRVLPEVIEFWQGRPSRMHDRLQYTRSADGWTRVRLAP